MTSIIIKTTVWLAFAFVGIALHAGQCRAHRTATAQSIETRGPRFAIAGLIQSTLVQDKSKFPLLGDLPILGALFRSDSFKREETELVIVVTPYIVRPFDARQMVLPTDGLQSPSDFGRYFKDGHLTGQARPGARLQKSGPGVGLRGSAGFRLKR